MTDTRELSARECQVLRLLSQGFSNRQIAASLSLSENTVKGHLSSIFQKLDASSRTEAVSAAVRRGIITLDSPFPLPGRAA